MITSDTVLDVRARRGSFTATLAEFCADNGIDHAERMLIVATLAKGGAYHGGGGTEPDWSLRQPELQEPAL